MPSRAAASASGMPKYCAMMGWLSTTGALRPKAGFCPTRLLGKTLLRRGSALTAVGRFGMQGGDGIWFRRSGPMIRLCMVEANNVFRL